MASHAWFLLTITLASWSISVADHQPARAADASLREQAAAAMHQAAAFYTNKVASHGGYVYHYSLDFSQRWGEGPAGPDQIWVQPPGTPTVGLAYLKAYEATGDRFYLDAAVKAADALIYGQLASGGWTNSVDFNPRGDKVAQYRNGRGRGADNSTLDDDISQAAIRFLAHADRALGFQNKTIHDSVQIALAALLAAQFPNGGFPQVWTKPVSPQPIVKANFPSYEWRTQGKVKNYWDMYTLNDNLAGNVAATLRDAFEIYGDGRYKNSLLRLGDFLILAQLPEPQPAWAQQYDYQMHPIWARRFEPPAVTGSESQDAMEALMIVYRISGDPKYLAPIPSALAYLRRSLLSDGRVARYYELQTNKPLYMTREGKKYSLTYSDGNLPDHYGWKRESRLDSIDKQYRELTSAGSRPPEAKTAAELEPQVRQIIKELDNEGRWISTYIGERLVGQPTFRPGDRYLASEVFSRNMETLAAYLLATR